MRTTTETSRHGLISLYDIKPRFVRFLDPIRQWLQERDVQPTTVTLLAIPVEIVIAGCFILGADFRPTLVLIPALAIAWMGLNALDGSLARSSGRSSTVGAAHNELVDRFGDVMVVVVAFLVTPHIVSSLVAVGILGSEIVALIGWATTGQRKFPGPMGKPDRAAILSVGAIAGIFWWPSVVVAFGVIGAGSLVGAVIRSRAVVVAARSLDRGVAP